MICLSNASPASATPSVPMMSSRLAPARLTRARRADGEVARAAAEVANEDELVAVERLLVAVGRRHRLVLEDDVVEAAAAERGRSRPARSRCLDSSAALEKWTGRPTTTRRGRSPPEMAGGRASVAGA